jgi:hypothetical protein
MARFKFYNVQLLPLDTGAHGNIGADGYKTVLSALSEITKKARTTKKLEQISAPLRNSMFFSPFKIDIYSNYAAGTFLKFDHIDAIRDLYTGDETMQVGEGLTSKRYSFDFLFDYSKHILAIRIGKGIPSREPLIDALNFIFTPIVESDFPKYTLRIAQLTSRESLDEVLKADSYSRVDVQVTFSNSDEFDEQMQKDLEKELKKKNVHDVHHIEKADKNAQMKDMSKVANALLRLATKHGNATVKYNKAEHTKIYHMADFPVIEKVKVARNGSRDSYLNDIQASVDRADKKSKTQTPKKLKTKRKKKKKVN